MQEQAEPQAPTAHVCSCKEGASGHQPLTLTAPLPWRTCLQGGMVLGIQGRAWRRRPAPHPPRWCEDLAGQAWAGWGEAFNRM